MRNREILAEKMKLERYNRILEEELKIERTRAQKGLCQELKRCKEQREELSSQREE